jgi:hypothetical protein
LPFECLDQRPGNGVVFIDSPQGAIWVIVERQCLSTIPAEAGFGLDDFRAERALAVRSRCEVLVFDSLEIGF